ncbi:hypothetical protein BSLG_003709 [Batrachochytrium salamandrivorans]|nr:hypothetical protein BSLG_003709 [Batrachochytrium salamandrivorans]
MNFNILLLVALTSAASVSALSIPNFYVSKPIADNTLEIRSLPLNNARSHLARRSPRGFGAPDQDPAPSSPSKGAWISEKLSGLSGAVGPAALTAVAGAAVGVAATEKEGSEESGEGGDAQQKGTEQEAEEDESTPKETPAKDGKKKSEEEEESTPKKTPTKGGKKKSKEDDGASDDDTQ